MQNIIETFSNYIIRLNRNLKRLIAIITDFSLCIICTWIAFYLRLEDLNFVKDYNFSFAALISLSAIPIFWLFGLYRTIFRYAGLSILFTISLSIFIYGLLYILTISVFMIQGIPRSIGLIQPMLLFFAVATTRFTAKYFLTGTFRRLDYSLNKKNVLIYGAGTAGRQLFESLNNNNEFRVIGFLDDDQTLHKQVLLGKKIYNLSKIQNLIETKDINLVLLAIPSINKQRKNEIIKNLNRYKLAVKSLPNLQDIISERVTVSDVKDFLVNDLLNREQVNPDKELLKKNIESKSILVTGSGGSIGSELCRQIIRLKPIKLVLVEVNEFALYKIYEELATSNKNIKLIPILANVQDQKKLEKIFETFKIDTVYHAAAYKHVNLVEENICEGVKNNVFGTVSVANASIEKNVSNLVLVSSDKAVRPTNIMGASKRFAELCLQAIHKNSINNNNFSIVRFGNVLESSGSVIPKFRKQILNGGPITLTHPDVSRYFMTIIEAAQLVIQAGALGKNSEVFVLDMGESIKIKDLISRMVKLSGLKLKKGKNSDGDIEIQIIGLKPGEKLYEELLIGDNPKKTIHPKILTAQDPSIKYEKLEKILEELKILLDNHKSLEVKNLLNESIKLYNSNSEIVDPIYLEEMNLNNQKNDLPAKVDELKVIKIK